MTMGKKISAVAASAALVFTGFTPAIAAPIAVGVSPATPIETSVLGWSADSEKVNQWRGNRGYRGYRHHRDRIDGGDVLAGILIIGGIAAIAGAASKNKRDQRYEDRDTRNQDYRTDNRRYDDRRDTDGRSQIGTTSMDRAVSACSDAVERKAGRDARISEITSVNKDGNGWRVEGELTGASESNFLCGATDDRVDFVQLGTGDVAFNF